MDENLIYSIAAVITGLAIGTGLLYILYLKGILNKRDLKRGIINGIVFAVLGVIIMLAFVNFGTEASTIVVAVMCLILWIFIRQIVKKRIQ
ncbi:MAG: hypothetical protein CVT89_04010 [Candidatus Altiarchaeales archaeon HGW-Altiarchaeales-2]|nr:MAG: hypothetical protein CVT89_04010 [Candidatus Altiarchaeales archaeon HGW-Altiarchaeales-2]